MPCARSGDAGAIVPRNPDKAMHTAALFSFGKPFMIYSIGSRRLDRVYGACQDALLGQQIQFSTVLTIREAIILATRR
jgi:hypothetical protein